MDEVVHGFVSWVEDELDKAVGNLKDPKQIKTVRMNRFLQIMRDSGDPQVRVYGPDDPMEIETRPQLEPGAFRDPAELFNKD